MRLLDSQLLGVTEMKWETSMICLKFFLIKTPAEGGISLEHLDLDETVLFDRESFH